MAYLDSSNVEDLVADIKALADQTYLTSADIPSYTNADFGQGYAICQTPEATAEKAVSFNGYKRVNGAIFSVKFTYGVPANGKLNVNSTGAVDIYYLGSPITDGVIDAGDFVTFVFSGAYYHVVAFDKVKPKRVGFECGYCDTASATAAKTVDISGFEIHRGGMVAVYFYNAVNANATLNVNGTGAKSIFYKEDRITNGIIESGDTVLFLYDGSVYSIIAIDCLIDNRHNLELIADYIGSDELQTTAQTLGGAINELYNGKVDKVSGKGLSTNDYTTTEKNKLSGIATGAEVNQNAFSNVKVGSTTVSADSKTDTIELVAGSNITLTPDATNDKVTIGTVGDYGVCDTAADVQIKEVTITGLTVATGVTIHVSFTYANSASQPKLSVNGDTAKFMVSYGSIAIGTTDSTTGWQAGSVLTLTYNGTYWVRNRSYNTNTTYTNESLGNGRGLCTPTSGSTAMTATLSGYTLATGGRVTIFFLGDVPANATLNINGQGAKAVTAKSSAGVGNIADGVIKNGDTATFIYDGSFYQLLSIDRIGLVDVPAIESKLSGIEDGAQANVNADWNASSGDAQILNKPSNLVQDASYVHTDNNFTSTLLTKLNGIESGAEVNVQANWSESDSTSDSYILNKPTLGSIVAFDVVEVNE